MKPFLMLMTMFGLVALRSARAESAPLPYFAALRSEVTNQLAVASNAPALDKKLAASLHTALKLIDKTKTNYAAGTKSLGTLTKLLLRTAASNAFEGVLTDTADTYLDALLNEEELLVDRLAGTDLTGAHFAAQKILNQLDAALHAASTNTDLILRAKYLSRAAKKFLAARTFTIKAELARPPTANVTATVSGAISFGYKGSRTTADHSDTEVFVITSGQPTSHPRGLRKITLHLEGVAEGMNHLMIGDSIPGNTFVTVEVAERVAGIDETRAYTSASGTATVIRRSADKRIFGSFEFTAGDPGSNITVTGTFSTAFSP